MQLMMSEMPTMPGDGTVLFGTEYSHFAVKREDEHRAFFGNIQPGLAFALSSTFEPKVCGLGIIATTTHASIS
ncbi:unnamed protein product [Peronospora belbahrii]|uniref:Uncharacterized protein n=1 Tax=Peronospora belbahrii TaxID=622444 RepID=A0AAU9KS51_9STRA|nr:unnamed protein product [Peronospora belbahrii]